MQIDAASALGKRLGDALRAPNLISLKLELGIDARPKATIERYLTDEECNSVSVIYQGGYASFDNNGR
jgi:hypothetical protein